MFSSTAEYALRAVVYLATHRGGHSSSHVIAAATKVPPGYISKILNNLVEAGIVVSRRGKSGGFELAKHPRELTVLDVVNASDPIKRIVTCPLGIAAHGPNLCKLHRKLDGAIALVEKTLASSSIQELVEPQVAGKCTFPTAVSVSKPLR